MKNKKKFKDRRITLEKYHKTLSPLQGSMNSEGRKFFFSRAGGTVHKGEKNYNLDRLFTSCTVSSSAAAGPPRCICETFKLCIIFNKDNYK